MSPDLRSNSPGLSGRLRKHISALISILVAACIGPPSSQELVDKYTSNPMVFERLKEMIREDSGSEKCLEIGLRRIGRYEEENNGRWSNIYNRETKLDIIKVLNSTGLSEKRYRIYTAKLTVLGARSITYCKGQDTGSWISIFVSHSGFCISTINWNEKSHIPETERTGGDFHEITPLRNGWYAEVGCS